MEGHHDAEQITVPVIEEELVTGMRAVKTGSLRARKRVEHIRKEIDMPTVQDVVSVSRVSVNRVVTTMPNMREEGDTLIVPVVDEEIVVHKRLVSEGRDPYSSAARGTPYHQSRDTGSRACHGGTPRRGGKPNLRLKALKRSIADRFLVQYSSDPNGANAMSIRSTLGSRVCGRPS